jgi:predicted MFS family arabinose efflux permease
VGRRALGAAFTLARFSEAFLVLRSHQVGVPTALVPLVMVVMSLVYSATAYPFGKLSDSMSLGRQLGWGLCVLCVLVAGDLILARATGLMGLLAGIGHWGVRMGMIQGLIATMVADTAPDDLRGTA